MTEALNLFVGLFSAMATAVGTVVSVARWRSTCRPPARSDVGVTSPAPRVCTAAGRVFGPEPAPTNPSASHSDMAHDGPRRLSRVLFIAAVSATVFLRR